MITTPFALRAHEHQLFKDNRLNQRYLGFRAMFIVRQAILDQLARHYIAINGIDGLASKEGFLFLFGNSRRTPFFGLFPESRYGLIIALFKFIFYLI